MQEFLGLPLQASAHAAEIDRIIVIVHWLMAVLFVGWGTFFTYTLVRFRASANPKADYAGVKSHTSTQLEIGVAVDRGGHPADRLRRSPPGPHRVNDIPARGGRVDRPPHRSRKQFEWHSHYPGRRRHASGGATSA